jgi:hypothetical protein
MSEPVPKDQEFERVWQFYDALRSALLNKKYYGCRLADQRRMNFWLEWILAFATSTAVAAWAIWKQDFGVNLWAVVGAIAVVLSITKPLLKLPEDLERLGRLHTGFTAAHADLTSLVEDIRAARSVTTETVAEYQRIRTRLNDLATYDDPRPHARLKTRCTQLVLEELPHEQFWVPA